MKLSRQLPLTLVGFVFLNAALAQATSPLLMKEVGGHPENCVIDNTGNLTTVRMIEGVEVKETRAIQFGDAPDNAVLQGYLDATLSAPKETLHPFVALKPTVRYSGFDHQGNKQLLALYGSSIERSTDPKLSKLIHLMDELCRMEPSYSANALGE